MADSKGKWEAREGRRGWEGWSRLPCECGAVRWVVSSPSYRGVDVYLRMGATWTHLFARLSDTSTNPV